MIKTLVKGLVLVVLTIGLTQGLIKIAGLIPGTPFHSFAANWTSNASDIFKWMQSEQADHLRLLCRISSDLVILPVVAFIIGLIAGWWLVARRTLVISILVAASSMALIQLLIGLKFAETMSIVFSDSGTRTSPLLVSLSLCGLLLAIGTAVLGQTISTLRRLGGNPDSKR